MMNRIQYYFYFWLIINGIWGLRRLEYTKGEIMHRLSILNEEIARREYNKTIERMKRRH